MVNPPVFAPGRSFLFPPEIKKYFFGLEIWNHNFKFGFIGWHTITITISLPLVHHQQEQPYVHSWPSVLPVLFSAAEQILKSRFWNQCFLKDWGLHSKYGCSDPSPQPNFIPDSPSSFSFSNLVLIQESLLRCKEND